MNSITTPVMRPGTKMDGILDILAGRWSSRAIDSSAPIAPEVLERLLEAARWAPSSFNNQPWRFLAFGPENADSLEKARKALKRKNAWALAAPRLIFVLCRTDMPGSRIPSGMPMIPTYESGMAALQMALQAAYEGLVFHQMLGFNQRRIREDFKVPENFAILTAVAIGWPGNPELVPEEMRFMETEIRTRKAISELVFSDGAVPSE